MRACLLTLAVVPLAFGVTHATPTGIPMAEGCSGATSGIVTSVSLLTGPTTVGLDGFFPIFVSAPGLDGAAVLPLLNVQVGDGQATVPGTIGLVYSQGPGSFIFGWSAEAPLTAGVNLQASASSGSLPANLSTLIVTDASPLLAAPTLALGQWSHHTWDVGAAVTCSPSGLGACSPIVFGAETEESARASLRGNTSPSPVAVAWEISVVAVDGMGTFARTSPTDIVYDTQPQLISMELHFTPGAGERCLRVVARDLRTSAVAMSEPTCSTPGMLAESTEDRIGSCGSAPAGYEQRWCEVSATLGRPCPSGGGAGGSGGSGLVAGSGGSGLVAGSGGSGVVPGTGGYEPAVGGSGGTRSGSGPAAEDGDKRTFTEGCGCRTWRSGSTSFGGLAVFAAALGLLVRKRVLRRSRGTDCGTSVA